MHGCQHKHTKKQMPRRMGSGQWIYSKAALASITLALPFTLGLVTGCAEDTKQQGNTSHESPRRTSLAQIAGNSGVDLRYLLTAAYVQSQMSADGKNLATLTADARREPVYGMALNEIPTDSQDSLEDRTQVLANRVADIAKKRAPKTPFDWLLCTAQAIVGEGEKDPNIRDFQVRMLTLEMIDRFNSGFTMVFPDNEAFVVKGASENERIELKQLDAGRSRAVASFRLDRAGVAEMFIEGNGEVIAEPRPADNVPKIVLRHCASNTVACFDHLRRTKDAGVHFLAYRAGKGAVELVQFQSTNNDLFWYGKKQANTVTIMISGNSGLTADTSQLDWYEWEDYLSLRNQIFEVYNQIFRTAKITMSDYFIPGTLKLKPDFLKANVLPYFTESAENLGNTKNSNYLMPATWDNQLFQEILTSTAEFRAISQIRVQSPELGQIFPTSKAFFSLYPDIEATQIEVYQDKRKIDVPGQPWDLIRKEDLLSGNERYEFEHSFSQKGLTNNKLRTVKLVTRNNRGILLGSKIVKLRLAPL